MPASISAMIASGASLRGLSDVTKTTSACSAAALPISGRLVRSRSPPHPQTAITRGPPPASRGRPRAPPPHPTARPAGARLPVERAHPRLRVERVGHARHVTQLTHQTNSIGVIDVDHGERGPLRYEEGTLGAVVGFEVAMVVEVV